MDRNMRLSLLNEAVCPQVGWEWTHVSQGRLGIFVFSVWFRSIVPAPLHSLHRHLPHIKPNNLGCLLRPGQSRRRRVPDPARPSSQAGMEAQKCTKRPATRELAALACLNESFSPWSLWPLISAKSTAAVLKFYYDFKNSWKFYIWNFCLILQSYKYKFKQQ